MPSTNIINKLYKKLKKTKIDSPNYITKKTNFNKYRNTLNKTLTNTKRVYYKKIFNLFKHDKNIAWGVISETLNRKVKNSVPETMTINSQDCRNKEIIVEEFKTFFAIVGKKNEQNIRKHEGSHYKNYLTYNIRCNFAFHLIDNNATIRIIKNTNTSARPEVRGTADVGWRSLNPLPINPPRTHSRLYHHMCLRTDGR